MSAPHRPWDQPSVDRARERHLSPHGVRVQMSRVKRGVLVRLEDATTGVATTLHTSAAAAEALSALAASAARSDPDDEVDTDVTLTGHLENHRHAPPAVSSP